MELSYSTESGWVEVLEDLIKDNNTQSTNTVDKKINNWKILYYSI